jgi:hypothetical protein
MPRRSSAMPSEFRIARWIVGVVVVVLAAGLAGAQQRAAARYPRAQPPTFDAAKTADYFFDDVFTRLVGERPAVPPAGGSAQAGAGVPGASRTAAPTSATAGPGWSRWISASTLEDEIKSIKQEIDRSLTTPSEFAGRGHKTVRREFTVLAMLLAIIAEYDGDVRFKREAAAARDVFARTANNAKAGGNINVFQEARQRKSDLNDLLNGAPLAAAGGDQPADWAVVVARAPLMQRLEGTFQNRLSPALANADEFARSTGTVRHAAELISAIAATLTRPGVDDADDPTYAGFAAGMQGAAAEIVEAVKLKSYDQARAAAGKIDKACSQCHEAYR